MFVTPVIRSLLKAADHGPGTLRARLEESTKCDPARTAIVPALVRFDGESYRIRTAPWKGSSDLAGLSRANAMVVIPKAEGSLKGRGVGGFPFTGVAVSTRKLTHVDSEGRSRMVDVSAKEATHRVARAEAFVRMAPSTLKLLRGNALPKGNALETARIAGIQAAKKTSDLIPLCHLCR
jgi:hypothetical protein